MDNKYKFMLGIVFLSVFIAALAVTVKPQETYAGTVSSKIHDTNVYGGTLCVSVIDGITGETKPNNGGCDHNLVVNEGLNALRDMTVLGTDFGNFTVIAVENATGAGAAPAATDTGLDNEFTSNGLSRKYATVSTTNVGNFTLEAIFTTTGSGTLISNKTCIVNQTTVAGDTTLACANYALATMDASQGDQLNVTYTGSHQSG